MKDGMRQQARGKNKRKIFAFALGGLLFAVCAAAQAQQSARVPRIGVLSFGSRSDSPPEAFRKGLSEVGYVEGKNIVIEYRSTDIGERLSDLAAELVHLKVDVIVAESTGPTRAAKQATATIPIVMATSADPIGSGLVESLARPGGNVTGLTNVSPDLAGKRLELLKDSVPHLSRVAIFGWRRLTIQGGDASFELELRELQDVAQGLRLQLQILELRTPDDFDNAFRTAKKWGAGALYTSSSSILATQRKNIIELAEKNRLPALYPYSGFAQSVLCPMGQALPISTDARRFS